ncbi:MAG: enoyl-CoA hydratase/isomerase family protein [Pseudomonadota bacterium]
MAEELVIYTVDDKVSIITLNRPSKLNALNKDLREALVAAFQRAESDPATSVVVLRAEGRSFCVGYDIGSDPEKDVWRHDALRWHEHLTRTLNFEMTPWYLRKPVVASVQGHVLGGGCELAMFCDLTIAADNAQFGEPEVRFSDTGPGIVMPWIIGYKRARELLYFGDMIDAKRALELGMVNRVVPLAELASATLKIRAPAGPGLARGAGCHQAVDQPRRRRRRLPQRHAGGARHRLRRSMRPKPRPA